MKDRKRSLSNTGGKSRLSGDPALAAILGRCLDVDPEEKLLYTHGFHAYPGRMHPETARRIIEAFPGGLIADPFVGSGTTAVEAVRSGRPFVGCDISQIPLEIAWTRTRIGVPEESRKVELYAQQIVSRAFKAVENDVVMPPWVSIERDWYDPHTLREIVVLKLMIEQEGEKMRRILLCVLSSILVRLSKQISDSDVKQDAYFKPRPRGAAFRNFGERSSELTKALLQLSSDLYKRKVAFLEPELKKEDARTPGNLPPGKVDLIVTSPPYAGVYDYSRHQARRYPIFGEDPKFAVNHELGSRKDASRYKEDMLAVMKNLAAALTPTGRLAMVIGDGQLVKADTFITETAAASGLKVLAMASQGRKDWSGGPPKQEHLILMGT